MIMGILLIALAASDSLPEGDSLPVFRVSEVIATASLPGARAESLSVEGDPARSLRDFGLYDYGGMVTPGFSGLPSRHTAVFINGVPLNSPATGTVDLSLLPMVNRGLLTLSGPSRIELWLPESPKLRLGAGSLGLASAEGFALWGPTLWGISYRRADNCYRYTDEFGRSWRRVNSDESQLAGAWVLRQGNLSAFVLASATERGSPGPIGFPTPSARLSDTLALGSVSYKGLMLFGVREATTYADAPALSRTIAEKAGGVYSKGNLVIEAGRERALGIGISRAKAQAVLVRKGWFCRAGAMAWDGPKALRGFLVSDAGVSSSYIRATVFCDAVPPAINDLAWPDDGFSVGNPALRPEITWGGEAGFELPWLSLWASAKLVEDYIAWVPGDRWTPLNLDRVAAPEVGASLSAGFAEVKASWNPVRWGGKRLAHLPDWRASAGASLGYFRLYLNYTGPRLTTPGGLRELPGFFLADAGLSLSKERFGADFWVYNLFDETPQQIAGYPLPGRRFSLEITWRSR
jgi:hypothetical protein